MYAQAQQAKIRRSGETALFRAQHLAHDIAPVYRPPKIV